MSKIRATQRLIVEDFPDQKAWIGKLFSSINDFTTQAIKAINGGLDFSENSNGVERELGVTFNSYANSLPLGFRWPLATRPHALQVVQALENLVPIMVVVAWEFTADGDVQITDAVKLTNTPAVLALVSGNKYKFRIRVSP